MPVNPAFSEAVENDFPGHPISSVAVQQDVVPLRQTKLHSMQLLIFQVVQVSRSGWLFGGCSWRGFLAFLCLACRQQSCSGPSWRQPPTQCILVA